MADDDRTVLKLQRGQALAEPGGVIAHAPRQSHRAARPHPGSSSTITRQPRDASASAVVRYDLSRTSMLATITTVRPAVSPVSHTTPA